MAQIIMTDGANTKSINPWDVDANPDAWTWLMNPEKEIDSMFYKVAASFRAVNKRAIAASNVPFSIMKGETIVDDSTMWKNQLKFMMKPKDLIKRISLSLTFKNAAYLLMGKDALHQIKGLHFLVPTTITPILNFTTGDVDYYERSINGSIQRIEADDPKLVKIWQLDHTTELLPSKNTAVQAIFNSTGSIYFADLFIRNFYERGGVKPTVLALKGAVFNENKEEIERGWSKFLRNLSRFSSKIFNAETMDLKPIGAGVDDLKNNEVYRQAIENIAMGIGMPTSHLLSDWDSYATATVDYMMWQRDDIFPLCEAIAEDMNLQVFGPLGYRLVFNTEIADSETQDPISQSKSYQTYIDAGVKPSVAAQIVGIEMPAGIEYDELDKMAEENDAKQQAKEQADRDSQMEMLAAKQPAQPAPVAPVKPPKSFWTPTLGEYKDLSLWQDVALRRNKKGQVTEFDFLPTHGGLPDEVTAEIKAALAVAVGEDAIKAAFDLRFDNTDTTPAPAYKTSEIILLAEALNNFAVKTTEPKQEPVNIVINNQREETQSTKIMSMFAKTIYEIQSQKADPQVIPPANITFSPIIQPSEVTIKNNTPVTIQPAINEITVKPADVIMPPMPKEATITTDANGKRTLRVK